MDSSKDECVVPFTVARTVIPVFGGGEMFPVRRIYCIARNYRAHAIEMGADPDREDPFFFQKPSDAAQFVSAGTTVDHPYPPMTREYHYEAELVAAIGKQGRNIQVGEALQYVWGYAVGLDMTRRDLQRVMRAEKKPWEIGKSFDRSAPIGAVYKVAQSGHYTHGEIWLKVNGCFKQKADLSQMIWSVAEQISKLSEAFELFPGDLIFSGTPENVGAVSQGDVIEVHIDGMSNISLRIV